MDSVALILTFVGAGASALAAVLEGWLAVRSRRQAAKRHDPVAIRRQRIGRLTTSLQESAQLLSDLESDIAAGQARADDLQRQIDRNTELAKLTEQQADAMQSVLADVVGRSDRRGFWQQFAMNALFFALGVGVTFLVR